MAGLTLQDIHRARIRSAIERKGLTTKQVAVRAGLHDRTVRRFLDGDTFSLDTLAAIEQGLRLDPLTGELPPEDSGPGNRVKILGAPPARPVVGWEQAAKVLQISTWTLWVRRRAHGDRTQHPWWKSAEAVLEWFERLTGHREG